MLFSISPRIRREKEKYGEKNKAGSMSNLFKHFEWSGNKYLKRTGNAADYDRFCKQWLGVLGGRYV